MEINSETIILTPEQDRIAKEIVRHLDQRKRVNPLEFFEALRMQELFEKDPSRFKILFGGNRAGKTEGVAKYIIEYALSHPKARIWCCSETFAKSVEIQQRKIWCLLPKDKTLVKYGRYDEENGFTHRKLRFANKAMIFFKSYDQGRGAFDSDDIDLIWNDEEPPYEIYKEQKMRLMDRDGEMIFSMTSLLGMTDLLHDIYEGHQVLESKFAEHIGEELPRLMKKEHIRMYVLWTPENPHINQDRLRQEIAFMTKAEIRTRVYGIPTGLEGKIYPTFNTDIHCIPADYVPTRKVCIWHVLDPHDAKPWAMQWWVVDVTGTAYCVREYPWKKNFNEMSYDDKTYTDYARLINDVEIDLAEQYGRNVSVRIIDKHYGNRSVKKIERETGAGRHESKSTIVKEMRAHGFKFIDCVDEVEARHIAVRERLFWKKNDEGELTTRPTAYIVDECENTIRHLSRYSRKPAETPDGDMRDKAKLFEKYKDFCDCTGYFFMGGARYIPRIMPRRDDEESVKLY